MKGPQKLWKESLKKLSQVIEADKPSVFDHLEKSFAMLLKILGNISRRKMEKQSNTEGGKAIITPGKPKSYTALFHMPQPRRIESFYIHIEC